MYVNVNQYSHLVGADYLYNALHRTVTVSGKIMSVRIRSGEPTVPIRKLAAAAGGERISWFPEHNLAYSTNLWKR